MIVRPDGQEYEATAQISLSHLNVKMTHRDLSMDQGWRVTILLAGLTGDDVPDDSRIYVSQEPETHYFRNPKADASMG